MQIDLSRHTDGKFVDALQIFRFILDENAAFRARQLIGDSNSNENELNPLLSPNRPDFFPGIEVAQKFEFWTNLRDELKRLFTNRHYSKNVTATVSRS